MTSGFAFDRLPLIGTILRLDRQDYRLVEIQPHIRQDGALTVLLRWKSECPNCSKAFEVTTPMRGQGLMRRCPPCRRVCRGRRIRRRRGNRPLPVTIIPA